MLERFDVDRRHVPQREALPGRPHQCVIGSVVRDASPRFEIFPLCGQEIGAIYGEQYLTFRYWCAEIVGNEVADIAVEFQRDIRQQALIVRNGAHRTDAPREVSL